jgi:hypothetical protein
MEDGYPIGVTECFLQLEHFEVLHLLIDAVVDVVIELFEGVERLAEVLVVWVGNLSVLEQILEEQDVLR